MKNLTLLIGFFCFLTIQTQGQETRNKAAFVGLEYQTKSGELIDGQKFDLGYRLGYAMVEEFDKGVFKIEFSTAYKGARFNVNGNDATVRELHLDFNVNSQWKIKNLFNVGGGAFFSRVLKGKQEGALETADLRNNLGFDIGFVGILGKNIGRYLIELRYKKGVINTGFGSQELRGNDIQLLFFVPF